MSLTFNGAAKTITHSGGELSVLDLWSRYVDWLAVGDNSKYGELMTTVGRDKDKIPLYVILAQGVTIVVSDNSVPTVVTNGVLETANDSDPFGGAVVNVRYEKPGIAIGYSSNGVTGPSAESIASAVIAALNATTGARTLGQHLQIQTAVLAGEESGAGTGHIAFTDGSVIVEADVPLPGVVGNRTNVTTSGV